MQLALDFQIEIFANFMASSSLLLVLAKGLCPFQFVHAIVSVLASPKLLVFVLNLEANEEVEILAALTPNHDHSTANTIPFKIINTETLAEQRSEMYLHGGVISITSRILLTDMLRGLLPVHLVTGILVLKAHCVTEFGLEAFILELFRDENKVAFIKAISDCPEAFVGEFAKLEKSLKYLKVQNLFLYPRFHTLVKDRLDKCGIDVSEVNVSSSQRTRVVQLALYQLLENCIHELKKINKSIDIEDCTIESVLTEAFDLVIKRQLDPVWHTVGIKTKQLLQDVRTLKFLLLFLFENDPVSFYHYLETLFTIETSSSDSYWMHLDSAQIVFKTAKERVFELGSTANFKPEYPAKWSALTTLLDEIFDSTAENSLLDTTEPNPVNVVIIVNTEITKAQLDTLLVAGPDLVLKQAFAKYQSWRTFANTRIEQVSQLESTKWSNRRKRAKSDLISAVTSTNEELFDIIAPDMVVDATKTSPSSKFSSKLDIQVKTFSNHDTYSWLYTETPKHIILYDTNLAVIRQIEVYKASSDASNDLSVYMLVYKDTVEEQLLLLAIREEKRSFESLIRAKATMTVPQIEKVATDPLDIHQLDTLTKFSGTLDPDSVSRSIIVDIRELRSSLPFVLYKHGFKLEPLTIEIGDYLLSPEVCVERKSVADLISSLNSGRLYTQAAAMCATYEVSILLIEFDQTRPFILVSPTEIQSEIATTDVLSKLVLLLIHFPRLRIIWSPNLHATANLFFDLKRNRNDPTINPAPIQEKDQKKTFSSSAKNMLLKFPGVTEQNVHLIMNQLKNLKTLCNQSQAQLEELLGPINGQKLWRFIHEKPTDLTKKIA